MRPLRLALGPLAWTYGGLAALRRRAYGAGWLAVRKVGVPVISVGALRAGGSGKTPVAGWLAGLLQRSGLKVGLVSGGYGGRQQGLARVGSELRWCAGAARRLGDEAVLLAGWHPEALVIRGRDKAAAAQRAVDEGAQVVVVDDGFQHCALHRDLDLLLDDGSPAAPFPAGDGREGGGAAAAADLLWHHRRDGGAPDGGSQVESRLVAETLHALDGTRLGSASDLRGRRVFLMAGVARPQAFRRTVERLGARVVGEAWSRDHHPFPSGQYRRAARAVAELILCTEKDAARLAGDRQAGGLVYLACRVELTRGEALLRSCLGRLVPGAGI